MFYRFVMPPFRALALATWRKAVLDVSIARADGARRHLGKTKNAHELAYSTTSSSAKDSLWHGAPYQSKRGSQRKCEQSSRQPSKGSERTRRPQRPPGGSNS